MKRKMVIFLMFACMMITPCYANSRSQWETVEKNAELSQTEDKIGDYYFKISDEEVQTDDGITNHNILEVSTDNQTFKKIENIETCAYPVYNNGLYFIIDSSMEMVPENKRYSGFSNSPAYILDRNLNVINTIEYNGYIKYKGYYNGFHYISVSIYKPLSAEKPWEAERDSFLYRSSDGITLEKVDTDNVNTNFLNGIELYNDCVYYTPSSQDGKANSCIIDNNNIYTILRESNNFVGISYENNRIPLLIMYYDIGEKIVDWIDGREAIEGIEKKYLTMDCIYGVEMPDDVGSYQFEFNGYYYFDKDDVNYYRIPKEAVTDGIKIIYNDKILAFDTPPITENDRTLVPMRFLFEQMGANVDWENSTQTATVEKENEVIAFSIDNTSAKVNNQIKTMDVPARLINDKTMIPLRFLSEELGYNVEWDEATKTVTITE